MILKTDDTNVSAYKEALESRIRSLGIDPDVAKRQVRPRPKEICLEQKHIKNAQKFYDEHFDGRPLDFTTIQYRVDDLSFSVKVIGDKLIAVDLFIDHKFVANIFYENDPIPKDVLDASNKGYFCLILSKEPVYSKTINGVIYSVSAMAFYQMFFGDDLDYIDTNIPKKAIREAFKKNGRYRAGHYTPSGKWVEGHYVYRKSK